VVNADGKQEFKELNWYDPSKMNNFEKNGTVTSSSVNKFKDDTEFKPVGAINHILALKSMNYINYMPFQGRMSAFYYHSWQKWNPEKSSSGVASVHGMGRTSADQYYSSQSIGYRVIPYWAESGDKTTSWGGGPQVGAYDSMKDSEWLFGKKLPKELKKDSYDTAILTMPEGKPKDFPFTNKEKTKEKSSCTCWTGDKDRVTTTNGECVSTLGENCLVDSLYTWKDEDDKVYTNVANRMIQEEALRYAQTSGFTTIIVVQWADLMICKTRWLSIADQGMVNPLMNFGLLFETILGSLMCYFTPLGAALNTRPLRFSHWFPGMPFCIFIFLYDECRKWLMRKTEKAEIDEGNTLKKLGGWLKENTYY
jgi:hypothetical protein